MIEIIEYIYKLDKSGNYKLADELENKVRKVYAQAVKQTPGQGNHMLDPNFAFILNQLLMKEQSKMTSKKPDTDTLSPTKNTDVATLRKQVNKIISDGIIQQKKIKTIENDLGALPSIEGKIGKVSELTDQFNTDINKNTSDIANNTEDIMLLQESVDTLK